MELILGRSRSAAARRRREIAERRTKGIAVAAGLTTGAVLVVEVLRVWRRGDAPLPAQTEDVYLAAEQAIGQTVEVALAGYKGGSTRENALLNLHLAFLGAFVLTRASTTLLRDRGRWGPLRNVVVKDHHIHHFVPGIAMAFISGGISIVARDGRLDPILAVPFGVGVALTLDESALLLKLDDVYWSEDGIVSVQITLATLAMLSALALALRVLRRGEAEVLDHDGIGQRTAASGVPMASGA